MLLLLAVLAIALPVLWAVSFGALRDARRAREVDPREGCQAWVEVRGQPGRRYRCARPRFAGGTWCRRHEVAPDAERGAPDTADAEVELIDEPQDVGRALAQARFGIPVAIATVVALLAATAWLVARLA